MGSSRQSVLLILTIRMQKLKTQCLSQHRPLYNQPVLIHQAYQYLFRAQLQVQHKHHHILLLQYIQLQLKPLSFLLYNIPLLRLQLMT